MAIRDFLGESTNNLVSVLYIELINSHERGQKESHSVWGGLEMVPANPLQCLNSMQQILVILHGLMGVTRPFTSKTLQHFLSSLPVLHFFLSLIPFWGIRKKNKESH